MRNHKVAIQGTNASFHDLAARKFYGEDIDLICCTNFRSVCEKVVSNEADYGVMAVENFTAGSILSNYQLIESFDLKIIGEVYQPIQFHIMGVKGADLSKSTSVLSHPMALAQCQEFLNDNTHMRVLEFSDTAGAAKKVAEDGIKEQLAIGNEQTAATYGLEILQRNIASNPHNFTRFLVLTKGGELPDVVNKASLCFRLKNEPNALVKALSTISSHGLNCTKIQSVPNPFTTAEFTFHIDVEFDNEVLLKAAFKELENTASEAKILGAYGRNDHLLHQEKLHTWVKLN